MFNWLKKGTKNVSENVVDSGKNLLGTESIVEAGNEIKGMAKKILSPKDMIKNAKKETFKDSLYFHWIYYRFTSNIINLKKLNIKETNAKIIY